MFLLLFISILAIITANPVPLNEPKPINDASLGYAVDFSQLASKSQFTCLKGNAYNVAFVRAYTPASEGTFDSNSITNVNNAFAAGVSTEVFMTPQPMSVSKSGGTQLTETYNGLIRGGITVRQIWMQVVSSKNWASPLSNMRFIESYIDQLKVLGLSGGIYTSSFDWDDITSNFTGASSLPLWYINSSGGGLTHESSPVFSDFVPFGGWTTPVVKQFAQNEAVCGVSPLNRDIYTTGNSMKKQFSKATGPIVGGNIQV